MTLPFSQTWPSRMVELAGQPNLFVEKIWESLTKNKLIPNDVFFDHWYDYVEEFGINLNIKVAPKHHTIRIDPHDRWKAGNDIHFVINNRTKDRFQFAPVLKVKSVQKIRIVYENKCSDYPSVAIDGKPLFVYHEEDKKTLTNLAINDGFPSIEAFFQYFNQDFTGKIIHWTDFSYCG